LKDIRRHFSAEDKIRIVLDGLRCEGSIAELCRKEGIACRTFYRWYDRYLESGPEALEERPSAPSRVWNRIAPEVQDQIVEMALDPSEMPPREMPPREMAVRFKTTNSLGLDLHQLTCSAHATRRHGPPYSVPSNG